MNSYNILTYSTGFDDNTIYIYLFPNDKKLVLSISLDTPISSNSLAIDLSKEQIRQLGEALIKAANDE